LKQLESTGTTDVRVQTDMGPKGAYFQVLPIGTWSFQAVYWRTASLDVPSLDVLEELTELPGFNAGYRCAEADVFWQSESSIATFEQRGRSHRHLPKVRDETFGGLKIDTRGNPGRRVSYPGMWLQSCWQMWFGGGAYRCLPVTRLREFAGATRIATLPSGATFVQLYDDPFTYEVEENRLLQAQFREWSGMNELELTALAAGSQAADPTFELRQGLFPHGGVRLIIEWRDSGGSPARRSQASQRIDTELDSKGRELWSERRSVLAP
jgi:hypothetical protein